MGEAMRGRLSEIMEQIEERETDIISGLDTLDVIANEYFQDGTDSAHEEAQTFGGAARFARTSAALSFAGKAMREALEVLRDNTDLLYKWARKMAERLEDEATADGKEISLDAAAVLQKAGRSE